MVYGSFNAFRKPKASSLATAASVVPPGDVTAFLSSCGKTLPSEAYKAEPFTVDLTSASASFLGMPSVTADSIIDSISKNT